MNNKNRSGILVFVLGSLILIAAGVYWSQYRAVYSFATTPTLVLITPTQIPPVTPTNPALPSNACEEVSEPMSTPSSAHPKTPPKVDVLFLLDATASMGSSIEGVKNSIKAFVAEFQKRNMDARVGLIAFRDRTNGEEPQILEFNNQVFTTNTTCFRDAVGTVQALGGGDAPESSLDALVLGAHQPFRRDAGRKVVILITDAPPKVPDKETQSSDDAIQALRDNKINFLYFIVNDMDIFGQIRDKSGMAGGILPLTDAVTGSVNFDRLLPEIAKRVAGS